MSSGYVERRGIHKQDEDYVAKSLASYNRQGYTGLTHNLFNVLPPPPKHCATNLNVAGSTPDCVIGIFH
jgi:hypothetical protein